MCSGSNGGGAAPGMANPPIKPGSSPSPWNSGSSGNATIMPIDYANPSTGFGSPSGGSSGGMATTQIPYYANPRSGTAPSSGMATTGIPAYQSAGMGQFSNIQNQYASDTTRLPTMQGQPGTGYNTGIVPVQGAEQMGGTAMTGGLDPNPRTGNPPMMPPVQPGMGLLGGGSIGGPSSFVNGKPVMNVGNPFPGSQASGGMTPAQWAMAHGNGANGGPMYDANGSVVRPRDQPGYVGGGPSLGPNHAGIGGNYANSPYNPANRDPNGPANRMAGAAAYQQSLTPEMLQQQINNGQRAPTSSVQMEAMLANMSPEARADYLAKSGYRTPTTGGSGPFGV